VLQANSKGPASRPPLEHDGGAVAVALRQPLAALRAWSAPAPAPGWWHWVVGVDPTGRDLEVLGGLLLSDFANLFVGAYCVKMRGGCYRFQAQYLRRIRVPDPTTVKATDRRLLAAAFRSRDPERATAVAAGLYGVDPPHGV